MSSDTALQFVGELLKLGLLITLPLLGVVLVVGLIVSVLQVVTQVQGKRCTRALLGRS